MELIIEKSLDGEVIVKSNAGKYGIYAITESIIRCAYTKKDVILDDSLIIEPEIRSKQVPLSMTENDGTFEFFTGKVKLSIEKSTDQFTWSDNRHATVYLAESSKELEAIDVVKYTTGGKAPIVRRVKTVDGERSFIANLQPEIDRRAYRAKLGLNLDQEELIYGFGQGEEGIYNYRGQNQYLYQHNMRIPMPMFISSKGYGILIDCCSLMTWNDDALGTYIYMDTVEQLDYYFILGDCLDEIIDGYRTLTGRAVMLPKWAYGYIQSKEAYRTDHELLEVVREYRKREIPLDGIVQDWNTWEDGRWGEKSLDEKRYQNIREINNQIHANHVHTMISIWPNMAEGGKNHQEFLNKNMMLGDYSTYNAFDEAAREVYWRQCYEGLYMKGFDAWWCDSTEPFSGPDWSGEIKREPWERFALVGNEHKKYLDQAKANAFALQHAKGIYENQRKCEPNKRVLNLIRSGYASQQKYGVVLWSGDICASWDTLKKQITEGINMGLCGMPYWTLDIGAFFVVGSAWQKRGCGNNTNPNPLWFWKGDYNDGVNDKGYCELYCRWFQYGTFLPMQRSHGTDTPREIWNFGKPGTMFYDTIKKYILLRYELMPYIYSLAGLITHRHYTMLRSLMFDFKNDPNVYTISNEYMFGPALLVCPVTKPMYYDSGNRKIDSDKAITCYLPAGYDWYDYWTKARYHGGQAIKAAAPLDRIPLFVKCGSILIKAKGLKYADQTPDWPIIVEIYPGCTGEFILYEDNGEDYSYEDGAYSTIRFVWQDEAMCLVIMQREGNYHSMEKVRRFHLVLETVQKDIIYDGSEIKVDLSH